MRRSEGKLLERVSGRVWHHKICAWCTETTQRVGTGREDGGGFRMGNTCIPVVDTC